MRWMNHLYIGDQAEGREKQIRAAVRERRLLPDAYVLMPASNPRDQLEIMRANYLRQEYFRKRADLTIVGIAAGKADAVNLVMRITDECHRLTGGADLRAFLESRIREEGTTDIV